MNVVSVNLCGRELESVSFQEGVTVEEILQRLDDEYFDEDDLIELDVDGPMYELVDEDRGFITLNEEETIEVFNGDKWPDLVELLLEEREISADEWYRASREAGLFNYEV